MRALAFFLVVMGLGASSAGSEPPGSWCHSKPLGGPKTEGMGVEQQTKAGILDPEAAFCHAIRGARAEGWAAQSRSEVMARNGMVVTSQPLAAQAGLQVLMHGSNAVDADPDFEKVPLTRLLSTSYAASLCPKFDPRHASRTGPPSRADPKGDTIVLSTADEEGNMG
jgi:hypothetical protein